MSTSLQGMPTDFVLESLLRLRVRSQTLLHVVLSSTVPHLSHLPFFSCGTLRMCVDHRSLNKALSKTRICGLEMVACSTNCRSTLFSLLDVTSGYHQMQITPGDVPKTAFTTPFGDY